MRTDGLHLIDFEQLKIESSTLAYRIEARSGEVLKLRGRLVETIQVRDWVDGRVGGWIGAWTGGWVG